ncbi:MAG: enoyl-CoA hydratase-related protein [Pseudomonadota bacterium]|nr:enoyl-CoA hydratase-related protein [Pseudomonadota bacterium]
MTEFETITVKNDGAVAVLTFERPQVRNAMNLPMIREIKRAFDEVNQDSSVRVIVLRGDGKVFCAGGDLNWMRDVIGQTEEEVMEDSRNLLDMYRTINNSPKLVITAIHGAAIAGGLGIVACSDVSIAERETKFCISEVGIGLVPGIIAAYILPRIGLSWFRYLAKTAITFDTHTARTAGLIHEVADGEDDLTDRVRKHVNLGLAASPDAITKTRDLIKSIDHKSEEEALSNALCFNAKSRLSKEAQEGISAFLDRRKPTWFRQTNQP